MHDVLLQSLMADLARMQARLSRAEAEIEQLRRAREPRLALPESKVFGVMNGELTSKGTVVIERIARQGNNWVRSGDTFSGYDLFLNEEDDPVEEGTICTAVRYEGVMAIDAFYCTPNDWLDEDA